MKAKTKCVWCKGIFDKKCFVEHTSTCGNCYQIILKSKSEIQEILKEESK